MAKIKLGNPPKVFAAVDVKFRLPDGADGVINTTFKYRTRREFGEFVDAMAAQVAADQDKPLVSVQESFEQVTAQNAKFLAQVIDSWDLPEPPTEETLLMLCNECPAATQALMAAHRAAVTEGYLGN